jgi:hypothetical protein
MDVFTRSFRISLSTLRDYATHVRTDGLGIYSALWLAAQVPPGV